MSLPVLTCPEPKEDLYMYLVVSNYAVSVVLLKVRDEAQWPVYHISKTLVNAGTWYLP